MALQQRQQLRRNRSAACMSISSAADDGSAARETAARSIASPGYGPVLRAAPAEPSGRHQRRVGTALETPISASGPRRRRNGSARIACGLGIAAHEIGERLGKMMPGRAHIGVVIAGNNRDLVRRADTFEPGPCRREFRLERQVDQIAGDGDVAGPLRLHVGDQGVEHFGAMDGVAVALPVDIAERALAGEFAQARARGIGGRCGSDRWASRKAAITRARAGSAANRRFTIASLRVSARTGCVLARWRM